MGIGIVKSFVEEKGYGFIQTEQKSIFFHLNDVHFDDMDKIEIGQAVKFDEIPTPKGNKAVDISIAKINDLKFVYPDKPIISFGKHKLPDGYVVLDESDYEIFVNLRDPNKLERYIQHDLAILGANAAINIEVDRYTAEEDSDSGHGTHYYTVHRFVGKLARVGKICSKGQPYSAKDLNSTVVEIYNNRILFSKTQRARVFKALAISSPFFYIASVLYFFFISEYSFSGSLIYSLFTTALFAVGVACFVRKDNPYPRLSDFVRHSSF